MAEAKSKATQLRAMDIKIIKMGQAQLGWDDELYRSVLASRFGGKTSATQLTWQERQQLIAYMKQQGFQVKSKTSTWRGADETMAKLRAMWFAMAEVGAVNKPATIAEADIAIEAWAKRMKPQLDAIRFASAYEMQSLIEAMKMWAKRVGAPLEHEQDQGLNTSSATPKSVEAKGRVDCGECPNVTWGCEAGGCMKAGRRT